MRLNRRIALQLIKEYWIQAIVSILWTFYKLYSTKFENLFENATTNFITSFFLLSYFTGQFFRVKKQQKVEDELSRLNHIINKLEGISKDILGNITGGESFSYIFFTKVANTSNVVAFMHHQGDYRLENLTIIIEIFNLFDENPYHKNIWKREIKIDASTPQTARILFQDLKFEFIKNKRIKIEFWTPSQYILQTTEIKKNDLEDTWHNFIQVFRGSKLVLNINTKV